MTRDLESRLRAALHDHADEVTPARLTRTLDDAVRDDPHTGAARPAPRTVLARRRCGCGRRGRRGVRDRAGDAAEQPVAAAGRDGHRHSRTDVRARTDARTLGHHQRGPGHCRPSRGAPQRHPLGAGRPRLERGQLGDLLPGHVGDPLPRQPVRDAVRHRRHPADRGLRHHVRRSPHPHRLERPERRSGMGRRRRDVAHDPARPAGRDLHEAGRQGPAHDRPGRYRHADGAPRARRFGPAHVPRRDRAGPDDAGRARPRGRHHLRARCLRQRHGDPDPYPPGPVRLRVLSGGLVVAGRACVDPLRARGERCREPLALPPRRQPRHGAHGRDGRLGDTVRLPGRLAGQHGNAGPGGGRLRRRTAGHADLAGDVTTDRLHPPWFLRVRRTPSPTPWRWWATSHTSSSRRRSAAAPRRAPWWRTTS